MTTSRKLLKNSNKNSKKSLTLINGIMEKNPLSKFIKSIFVILLCLSVVSVSCKKDKEEDRPKPPDNEEPGGGDYTGGGTEKGKYLGVIGFAGYTKTANIGLLNDKTKTKYKSFIDGLPMGDATWLYYSVDQAIETLKKAQLPEELVNVYIVTFTDGLDDGSATAFGDRSISPSEYLQRTNTKLKATTFGANKIPITAYSIGYKRSGTFTSSEEQTFDNNLKQLASDDNNAYPVTEMSVVNQKFQDIANSLYKLNTSQNLEVKINFREVGTKYRFTFDNVATTDAGALSSTLYIEATLGLDGQTATFENIQYSPGLSASGGSKLIGVKYNEKDVFVFKNLKRDSGDLLSTGSIKEFYKDPNITEWKWNDEFKNAGDTDIKPEIKSVIVMLVLDCSTSLNAGGDNGSEQVRTAAKNFIDILSVENSGGGGGGTTNPPSAPTGVKATLNGASVNVTWNIVSGATSYKVYYTNSATSTYNSLLGTVSGTSYTHNPSAGGDLCYTVKAVNSDGESDYSSNACCSYSGGSENPTLSPPTGVTATQNGSNISISWNNVSGATNYIVYHCSTSNGTYTTITNTTSLSYSHTSPLNGANYYKIKAQNSSSSSELSSYAYCNYSSGNPTLSPPTGVTATQNGSNISISWNNVSGATNYIVYHCSTSNGTYTTITNTTSLSYSHTSPLNGANYYKIKAQNSSSSSELSSYAYCNFSTPSTTAQVRFKKMDAYTNYTKMDLWNSAGTEALAAYDFGTNAGTSPYYEIPAGQHKPWAYHPDSDQWYCILDAPYTYNFQVGHKYSIVMDDDGTYIIFYVTDDGYAKSSGAKGTKTTVIKVPRENIQTLNGKIKADIKK